MIYTCRSATFRRRRYAVRLMPRAPSRVAGFRAPADRLINPQVEEKILHLVPKVAVGVDLFAVTAAWAESANTKAATTSNVSSPSFWQETLSAE